MISLRDPAYPYMLGIPCDIQPAFTPTLATSLALVALAMAVGFWLGGSDRG